MSDQQSRDAAPRVLPPGQRRATRFKAQHYGRVPRSRPDTWSLMVSGATATGAPRAFTMDEVQAMPRTTIRGDLHCVSRWTQLDREWEGVLCRTILELVPPSHTVTHVQAWAEYGYSSTLSIEDVASPRAILADRVDGADLTPEHGWPLRLVVPHLYAFKGPKWLRGIEYLREPVRGFWEKRGYHVVADPWREERYSYQE